MEIYKEKTACFSGYSPEKFEFPLDQSSEDYEKLLSNINLSILFSIRQGFHTFLCGMAQGFDILCGERVAFLRDWEYHDVKLVAVIPYEKHGNGQFWNEEWRTRHDDLKTRADEVIYIGENYHQGCFHQRNRYMVDYSGRLICFWDGKSGGSAYTVGYACKQNIEVINLAKKKAFQNII